jgi:hypothetical protein
MYGSKLGSSPKPLDATLVVFGLVGSVTITYSTCALILTLESGHPLLAAAIVGGSISILGGVWTWILKK